MEKAKVKKIVGAVLNVLVWVFVAISLLTTVLVFAAQKSKDGVPSLFGTSLITIETGSMKPIYNPGDLVFMKKLTREQKDELKPGDIITFRTSVDINKDGTAGDINTHKIYSHEEGSLTFVTKGENNPRPDNEGDTPYTVHYDDIIGICTEDGKIPGLGGVIQFLRSSLGFFLCIVLPLILFFLYELYKFITLLLAERSKKASANGAPDESELEEIKKHAIEEYLAKQAAAQEEEIKRRAVEEYIAKQKAQDAASAESENEKTDEQ